jgi:hypothetical protein
MNGFSAMRMLRSQTGCAPDGQSQTSGYGLCYLDLRNVKGFEWSHKRVYRIYFELELNLRIKLQKRLKRERPEPLPALDRPNQYLVDGFYVGSVAG